jgi:hypothetical protein
MQEVYELLNIPAEVAPIAASARRQGDVDPRGAQEASPERPDTHACSIEALRNAVADRLYAVSCAFQEKPGESYGYVSRAAELLRMDTASAIAGLNRHDTESFALPNPRGGLHPGWFARCQLISRRTCVSLGRGGQVTLFKDLASHRFAE